MGEVVKFVRRSNRSSHKYHHLLTLVAVVAGVVGGSSLAAHKDAVGRLVERSWSAISGGSSGQWMETVAAQLPNVVSGCVIKGNISIDTGERIYHVPGQKYYDVTRIRPRYGERYFCSEQEARAAGWRKSRI